MKTENLPIKHPLLEDFEDFFENALCGYVNANAEGQILRANTRLAALTEFDESELHGKRFSDILTIGGKIYYETHLWPLLRMQGFFDEVAVELACKSGKKLQVLLNAYERRDENGTPQFIRYTILKATDRQLYEKNLRMDKKIAETELEHEKNNALLREQFIAVLSHDLRNPLASIISINSLLANSSTSALDLKMVAMMQRSAQRMVELIDSVLDFARVRLGGGLNVQLENTELEPILTQVVNELRIAWPKRIIENNFDVKQPVFCDALRLSQLLSNLLANALTHGSNTAPVFVNALQKENIFELSVINSGKPISANAIDRLFKPFTREDEQPSKNGLGLGLYIAYEIALAHNGTLTVTSNEENTCFVFRMVNNPH